MNLNELDIQSAREKLDSGEITSLELTQACLARIKKHQRKLRAAITICEAEALRQAVAADKRLINGETGPLLGIPYFAKDNMLTRGLRTTAGSKMLENYIAPYDATVVRKLEEAGAVLLGKTNLDAFAHGSSTENSYFGATRNPHDTRRVPGGSSGGSAAAVADNWCLFALGSDTGGSIRQPASFCGVAGLKPSYGRVSRHGLISMTSSTDVIGPLTKTVADAGIVLSAIAGLDPLDSTTRPEEVLAYGEFAGKSIRGLRIGYVTECFDGLSHSALNVMSGVKNKLLELGAELVPVSLPHLKLGIPVYYIITPAEVSSNLARLDGLRYGHRASEDKLSWNDWFKKNRGEGFGPEAKRRIMLGTYVLSAGYSDKYYHQAQAARQLIIQEFQSAFTEVDILLTPTTPHPAFKLGANSKDPLSMYLEDIFAAAVSLAGLPAISVPAGKIAGLPIGCQLIAPLLGEGKLIQAGSGLEKALNNFNI
ncbi:MAG TPA: Asp-tRNA(Asn)/Glu-tRNA(Gln) amidotransferase subunit GatA [bacterium]|nr:Asp-tRNA(Asn)/Glu-tRNA(Gln) amidotransferase subunit GatA [bacterium]HPT29793.1 Asp-tRNA(Asn)/Glu-tRNA(Gln) amidotransferase subunit GatA [bacterium]